MGKESALAGLPVWARLDGVMRVSGLPNLVIRRLYNEGHIRARKVDPAHANSATIYNMADVLAWIENEAPSPERFKLAPAGGERAAV